jgi:ribosomal-protein-alanine N-acetyltransferase
VRIRKATAHDVEAVTRLEKELFPTDAWSSAAVAEELTGDTRRAVVACDDEGVCGYAVTMRSDDVVDLVRIAVAVPHRRTGLGRRLLTEVATSARAEGARRMMLEVGAANEPALRLYGGEGFVEIDRRPRYYRDGTDAVVLQKPLEPVAGEES